MSTSTWNPERRFPWLGDSLPCPSPAELAAEALAEGGTSGLVRATRRVAEPLSASARVSGAEKDTA